MKGTIIFCIFESILFFILLYFMASNLTNGTNCQFALGLNGQIIEVSTLLVIFGIYIFGTVSGLVYSMIVCSRYKEQLEFYTRKTEKLSVQNEIDTDDKEALQRKIASLEIALDNALKNK